MTHRATKGLRRAGAFQARVARIRLLSQWPENYLFSLILATLPTWGEPWPMRPQRVLPRVRAFLHLCLTYDNAALYVVADDDNAVEWRGS